MVSEKASYRLRLIGTAAAVVVGAVGIGLLPRCDDYQTKAMAKEQHERIMTECTAHSALVVRMLEGIARDIRKLRREAKHGGD